MSCRLLVWRGWSHFVPGRVGQASASRPPQAQPAKNWPRTASRLEPRTALNDVKDAFPDLGLLPQPPDSHLQTRTINNHLLSGLLFVDREDRIPYLPVRCVV